MDEKLFVGLIKEIKIDISQSLELLSSDKTIKSKMLDCIFKKLKYANLLLKSVQIMNENNIKDQRMDEIYNQMKVGGEKNKIEKKELFLKFFNIENQKNGILEMKLKKNQNLESFCELLGNNQNLNELELSKNKIEGFFFKKKKLKFFFFFLNNKTFLNKRNRIK